MGFSQESRVVYYEFVCVGTPSLFVLTSDPDPAKIPGAAQSCCREWAFARRCETGDGLFTPAIYAAAEARVRAEGYFLFRSYPAGRKA
jgi:hypothetical protein